MDLSQSCYQRDGWGFACGWVVVEYLRILDLPPFSDIKRLPIDNLRILDVSRSSSDTCFDAAKVCSCACRQLFGYQTIPNNSTAFSCGSPGNYIFITEWTWVFERLPRALIRFLQLLKRLHRPLFIRHRAARRSSTQLILTPSSTSGSTHSYNESDFVIVIEP